MANELDIKWLNLTKVLNEFADEVIALARQNLTDNGTNATYELFNSLEKIIEIGEDHYSVKISMADYAKYVENGRGPGKYPPPGVIENWIEIKPVTPSAVDGKVPSVKQLTFLISRKIANEGTEAQPFLEPAVEEVLSRYETLIDQAINDDVYEFINEAVIRQMEDVFGKK
jgi:hypothetical protein